MAIAIAQMQYNVSEDGKKLIVTKMHVKAARWFFFLLYDSKSSAYDKFIQKDTLAVGEVGLLGEIREVPYINKRLEEARRLGFKKFLTPKNVRTLREAVRQSFG